MLCASRDRHKFFTKEICEDDNEATYDEEDDEDESDDDKSDEENDKGIEKEQNFRIDDDDGNVFNLFNEQSDEEW